MNSKSLPSLFFLLFFALFTAILSGPAFTASDARTGETADSPFLRATLENGLKVVIVRNSLAPVATTVVSYLAGSNQDPPDIPGTAHALEHMMFRGSPGLSAGQLSNIVAELGGRFNAMTQATATQYFLTVPADDIDIALRIEATRMKGVLSTPELWKPERGAIGQEVVRNLSDPEFLFYRKLLEAMFRGTPYENTGLGSLESFDRTTAADLKKFHERWYAANNAVLVVVGNVPPDRTLEKIRDLFGGIPPKTLPKKGPVQFRPVKPETIRLKTGNPYGMLILAFRMPGYGSRDYAASEVLADVLGSTRGDLYGLVTKGKALATGFELMTHPDAGLGLLMAAFPAGNDPAPLLKEIKRILHKSIRRGFSADLVNSAKRKRVTQGELEKNSVQGLALAWSDALAVQGRSSPDAAIEEIARVSSVDVNRIARTYLRFDRALTAVLTPEASGKPVTEKRKGIVDTFEPQQEPQAGLPLWAQRALEKLELPKSSLNPVFTVLPNGIRLIFQKQNVSDTVAVYGYVKNEPNLQAPPGKEGVDEVLEGLFSFGTKSLDRTEFQKALDEIGALEAAGTEFSLKVLTGHFERGLQLLAENLLHPALPRDAFLTIKKRAAATAAGQLNSPGVLARRALKAALYPPGDPDLRHAAPDSVSALTIQDVTNYYSKVFRPDMTTIVVIGNIEPGRALQAVRQQFGSWTAQGKKPDVLLPPVPPNAPALISVPDKRRVQTKVVLAETLGITRTHPDYYALELGNHVLGGAFYATRLYRDLRERTGLVYNVKPLLNAGETRTSYSIRFACNPEDIARARGIIEYNLRDIQKDPVPEHELRRAKALLLREIPLSESSVDRIALGFLERTDYGLPLDEPVRAAREYLKLGPEAVRAAFEKWLRPDDLVQVTQGPVP